MKRIIVLLHTFAMTSGTETLLLRKSKWYIKSGYTVFLFSVTRNELHQQFIKSGINVHYIYFSCWP